MALRWQGFGDPGLRRGPSPSVASLQGVVRMQPPPLLHTDRQTHAHAHMEAPALCAGAPFLFRQESFRGQEASTPRLAREKWRRSPGSAFSSGLEGQEGKRKS